MSQKKDKDPYGYRGKRRYEESMAAISMVVVIAVLAAIVYSLVKVISNL